MNDDATRRQIDIKYPKNQFAGSNVTTISSLTTPSEIQKLMLREAEMASTIRDMGLHFYIAITENEEPLHGTIEGIKTALSEERNQQIINEYYCNSSDWVCIETKNKLLGTYFKWTLTPGELKV